MNNIEKLKDSRDANSNRSSINNNMNRKIFKYWQEVVGTWLLISLIIGALVGAIAGAFTVMNFKDLDMISLRIIRIDRIFATASVNVKWVSAGILIFILAYFLARKLTCRLDVR